MTEFKRKNKKNRKILSPASFLGDILRERDALEKIKQTFQPKRKKYYSPLTLVEFITEYWDIVEPSKLFIFNWHIEVLAEHLEAISHGQIRKLLINIPPGHMKSLIVGVFWPLWEWGEINGSCRGLFSSYGASLALRDSKKALQIVKSPKYQSRYPHIRLDVAERGAKKFSNTLTGFRQATSVGGEGTGARADRIVVDDPHKVLSVDSEKKRLAVLDWWSTEMATRGSDKKAAHVIIMQRVHHDDLSAWAIANDYEHLFLPGEYDKTRQCRTSLGYPDVRTEPGELLWPEMFPQETLASLKKQLGSYAYAAQVQQSPTPKEGGILKTSWWEFYTQAPITEFQRLVWSWDTAFKSGQENDWSVGILIGKTKTDYYLLDLKRCKYDYPSLRRLIVETYNLTKERLKNKGYRRGITALIEDKASGISLIQDLRKNTSIPIKPQKVDRDKVSRVNAIAPIIECGRVYLPGKSSWVDELLLESSRFPKAPHDDQIDALSQGLLYLEHSSATMWGNL